MSFTIKLHDAELILGFGHYSKTNVLKDRNGELLENMDLVQVLEKILPFQEPALQPLIQSWIDKVKVLRPFL